MGIRDDSKISRMREGGKVLVDIVRKLVLMVEPGINTCMIDATAEGLCSEYSVKPAFKGYRDYPAVVCAGPNDIVVHGIPNEDPLREGDIISIDMGIVYREVFLDMARTVPVGAVSAEARTFLNAVEKALKCAIEEAKTGNHVGDIGHAIQSVSEGAGYSVVREMVGHGLGYKLHEDPAIPGYGNPGEGSVLYDGQTIAIEAIVNEGSPDITISKADGWTSRTKDGKLSALFENTVLISDTAEILTPL